MDLLEMVGMAAADGLGRGNKVEGKTKNKT